MTKQVRIWIYSTEVAEWTLQELLHPDQAEVMQSLLSLTLLKLPHHALRHVS